MMIKDVLNEFEKSLVKDIKANISTKFLHNLHLLDKLSRTINLKQYNL